MYHAHATYGGIAGVFNMIADRVFFFVGSQYAVIIDVDSMSWLLTPIVHECALQSMLLLCGQCIVCRSLIHRFLDGIASSVGWCPLHRLSVAINCSLMIIALFDGGYCIICWWPVHGSLVAIASFVGRHCIVGW